MDLVAIHVYHYIHIKIRYLCVCVLFIGSECFEAFDALRCSCICQSHNRQHEKDPAIQPDTMTSDLLCTDVRNVIYIQLSITTYLILLYTHAVLENDKILRPFYPLVLYNLCIYLNSMHCDAVEHCNHFHYLLQSKSLIDVILYTYTQTDRHDTHTHTNTCTHTLTHICAHTHTLTHICAHTHTRAHTHAHTRAYTHTHTHTHACTHTHTEKNLPVPSYE